MSRERTPRTERVTPAPSEPAEPEAAERKGMRGHDDQGNVRPADGRYGLHRTEDESAHVRSTGEQKA